MGSGQPLALGARRAARHALPAGHGQAGALRPRVDTRCLGGHRPGSASFGSWEGYELNDERHHHLYVPDGFAHGFCVLSETADVIYKCSTYYDPAAESGFRFDDPRVGIRWPEGIAFQTSERDRSAPLLSELSL